MTNFSLSSNFQAKCNILNSHSSKYLKHYMIFIHLYLVGFTTNWVAGFPKLPHWVLVKCLFRACLVRKLFSQPPHSVLGLWPTPPNLTLQFSRWAFNLEYNPPQWGHVSTFRSSWNRAKWCSSCAVVLNVFEHFEHWNGLFSEEWLTAPCLFK
jgi:hypothetical protein